MKNKLTILVTLLSVASLVGCNSSAKPETADFVIPTADTSDVIAPTKVTPAKLLLNHKVAALRKGEEFKLVGLERENMTATNLSYTVKNDKICSVSNDGTITGLKKGETEIEVVDNDYPELKVTVPVYVHDAYSKEMYSMDAVSRLSTLAESDAEKNYNEVADYELRTIALYKNDVRQTYDCWDELLVSSKPEAYFSIVETDGEILTEDGSQNFGVYNWIFNTNKYFDTYIYHQTGDKKTFYQASTTSYMEGPRYVPLCEILENLFVSGKALFENTFDNAKLSSMTDFAAKNYSNVTDKVMATSGNEKEFDGAFFFECNYYPSNQTADLTDESNYGIPYGTPLDEAYHLRYNIQNGIIMSYSVHITSAYDIGEDHYIQVMDIDHYFVKITDENRNQYLVTPNKKEYTQVETLFDI